MDRSPRYSFISTTASRPNSESSKWRFWGRIPATTEDRPDARRASAADSPGTRARSDPSTLRTIPSSPRLHVRLEEVRRWLADEVGHEDVRRPVVERIPVANLLQPCIRHDGNPVGQRKRLDLVVRHVDHGSAEFAVQPLEVEQHLKLEVGVKVAHHFVKNEHRRIPDQRPPQRNPAAAGRRRAPADASRGCW